MNQKDLFIRALEYAENKKGTSFRLTDMQEEMRLNETDFEILRQHVLKGELFYKASDSISGGSKYRFSVVDKFRLLNYTELQEARVASRKATNLATIALLLSIITGIASIYYSHVQVSGVATVSLVKEQSEQIDFKSEIQEIASEVKIINDLLSSFKNTLGDNDRFPLFNSSRKGFTNKSVIKSNE